MTQIIQQIFANEMTEQGLAELREKYPETLKLDMSDDVVFKAGRKTRTECNKLCDAIKRRRLDVTGELKDYGDDLIKQIGIIYDVVILPFEQEDSARKVKAAEAARKHQELIDGEMKRIKNICGFVDLCRGKDSKFIQGKIEAVDLIETDIFHKDVIHEAIEAKKSTLHDLGQLLSDTITREKVDAEREELRIKQKAADEKLRLAEVDQGITDRLNTLRMVPADFFGKSSKEIDAKISSLSRFEITEEQFGDRCGEVSTALDLVVTQLEMACESAKRIEYVEAEEAKKVEAARIAALRDKVEEKREENKEEMVVHSETTQETSESFLPEETVDDAPIEESQPEPGEKSIEPEHSLSSDLTEWATRYELPLVAVKELFAILDHYGSRDNETEGPGYDFNQMS